MGTAFRCFTSDCQTLQGRPIAKILSDAYGIAFVIPYLAAVLIVTFGLFNLIMAIYVENTMMAAKTHHDDSKARRERESLRVAHTTKQLLKKICAAHHAFTNMGEVDDSENSRKTAELFQEITEDMVVSRELFLLLVQDPEIQVLLDTLDVPPERAHLFDVLDADDSGGLQIEELVQGLLKVRGDSRKSDTVACLLATKALHEIMRNMEKHMSKIMERLGMDDDSRQGGGSRSSAFTHPATPRKSVLQQLQQRAMPAME